MLNAYKYRLHPTREQSEFFNKSFGCVRFIYNWGLQKRIEAYMKDKGRISYVQLCSMLTDLKKEEQYSWLRDVSTECLQQALRNLDAAFILFLSFQEYIFNYPFPSPPHPLVVLYNE